MFERVLIANRGEIALRILRACRELGVRTVAVHSEADTEAKYVKLADESVCIGPPPSALSYLNIPAIISAAEVGDVEAIHPGYGFLSENAGFARACAQAGITFVGPRPELLDMMGDKTAARALAKKINVPTLPGTEEPISDRGEAMKAAKAAGFAALLRVFVYALGSIQPDWVLLVSIISAATITIHAMPSARRRLVMICGRQAGSTTRRKSS